MGRPMQSEQWRIINLGPEMRDVTWVAREVKGSRDCEHHKLPNGHWFITPLGSNGHFVAVRADEAI